MTTGVEPKSGSQSEEPTSERHAVEGAAQASQPVRSEPTSFEPSSEPPDGAAPMGGAGASTPARSEPLVSAPPTSPPTASDAARARSLPSYSLASVCLAHAVVFVAASVVLPWRTSYAFALPLFALAALHLGVGVLALLKRTALLLRAWTALAVASLVGLLALSWSLLTSALYLIELYRGIGAGVAVGLFVFWLVAVLFTVPISWWGLALARPTWRPRRATRIGAVSVAALAFASPFALSRNARAERLSGSDPELPVRLAAVARKHLSAASDASETPSDDKPIKRRKNARTAAPRRVIECDEPVDGSHLTLFVGTSARKGKTQQCLQASDETGLTRALEAFLEAGDTKPGYVKLDLVSGAQRLGSLALVLDALELRPGQDGVCAGGRCLMPWQLVAASAFGAVRPLAAVGDLAFGSDVTALRKLLDAPKDAALTRLETRSFVVSSSAIREPGAEDVRLTPTPQELALARAAVERHVGRAQLESGGFRYTLEPFSGAVDDTSTNLPRHAGTTLSLCELGERADVSERVEKALGFMAQFERKVGDMSAYSNEANQARLGPTALPLVALLSCRSLVHKSYDQAIGRAGRLLLHMQRPDGSFFPELDLTTGKPRGEQQPLYAAGQAVLALTLLESWAPANERATYRDATERAMQYYAGPYWHSAPYDFFFLEENWHCLAARAALATHRNDAYERFCLDYVEAKSRLIFGEGQGHTRALSGGYGVSPLFAPHNTATAGYGEALAAAISVRRARHMPVDKELALLERVLGFLVRNQWQNEDCFACARRADTLGGFSESSTSPLLRIDYAQHAWSALGHGGRELARREPNG